MGLAIDIVFLLCGLSLLAWGRQASILYPFLLNPDEAQVAANALIIKRYGFGWDVFDGTTCGFLHSLAPCWPHLYSGDVTYATLRITALALLTLSAFFLFLAVKRVSGAVAAVIFGLLFTLFFSLTNNPDFLHYNSEFLPLALILLANFAAVALFWSKPRPRAAMAACFVTGASVAAVFFSKLQASPMALAVFLFCCLGIWRYDAGRRKALAVSLFAGGFLPSSAVFIPLYAAGALSDFYKSYILWGLEYANRTMTFLDLHILVASEPLLASLAYFLLALCILAVFFRFLFRSSGDARLTTLICYYFILLSVTLFCIMKPGKLFPHYLTFLLPSLLLFTSALHTALFRKPDRPTVYYLLGASLLGLWIVSSTAFLLMLQKNSDYDLYRTKLPAAAHFANPNVYSWLGVSPSDSLLVWGWMPQWYALSPAVPASRETHPFGQIVPSSLRGYFRDRFLKDLRRTKPDFIIDGVRKTSFGFNDPSAQGLQIFPELDAIVRTDFTPFADPHFANPACPAVYVRNDRLREIDKILVPFADIAASADDGSQNADPPQSVADHSVTEDVCDDFWLLPDGSRGTLDIAFSAKERVGEVLLLNTNNGRAYDRSTETVRLSLLSGGETVHEEVVALAPHPQWTRRILDRPVEADALRVEILSFRGKGAGLNEVAVARAPK